MKRRGTIETLTKYPSVLGNGIWSDMLSQFSPGDLVTSNLLHHGEVLYGVVRAVDQKIGKVFVAWNNGYIDQVDPDEVRLVLDVAPEIQERFLEQQDIEGMKLKARRVSKTADVESGSVDLSNLQSRRAVYFKERGRMYQKTKAEVDSGVLTCPKCKGDMEQQSFVKGNPIYVCPECGWKITRNRLLNPGQMLE